jgi:hypothetical protein
MRISARDEASGRSSTLEVEVADERHLDLGSALDLVGTLAASQAVVNVLQAAPPRVTASMCLRVSVRQRKRPLGFCKRYFSPYAPLDDLSSAFGLIDNFKFGPLDVGKASVRMSLREGVREAFILDARAPRKVRPGQRIRIRMRLQRSRAGRERLSFGYRVPRSTSPGARLLTLRGVSGSGDSDFLSALFGELFAFDGGGPRSGPPRSIGELADRIAAIGRPQGIRATFARKGKGPVVYPTGRTLIRGKAQIPMIVMRPAKGD